MSCCLFCGMTLTVQLCKNLTASPLLLVRIFLVSLGIGILSKKKDLSLSTWIHLHPLLQLFCLLTISISKFLPGFNRFCISFVPWLHSYPWMSLHMFKKKLLLSGRVMWLGRLEYFFVVSHSSSIPKFFGSPFLWIFIMRLSRQIYRPPQFGHDSVFLNLLGYCFQDSHWRLSSFIILSQCHIGISQWHRYMWSLIYTTHP